MPGELAACLAIVFDEWIANIAELGSRMARVSFHNSQGVELVGELAGPRQAPVLLVMAHGFGSSKDSDTYVAVEQRMLALGAATLRFDNFACGESGGDFRDLTLSGVADGIQSALLVGQAHECHSTVLLASSFAGGAAIVAAATGLPLELLILRSPLFSWFDPAPETSEIVATWETQGYLDIHGRRVGRDLLDDLRSYDLYKLAPKINIKVAMIHGDQDEMVPLAQSTKMHQLLSNSTLKVVVGANHRYSSPEHFETCVRFIVDQAFAVTKAS